jgi:transcriptional regulator with XRE-family HTH domain
MASIVKKLRSAMGLSQEAFARLIGRSFGSVRMYETGRIPPLEVLAKMLAITRTTPGHDAIEHELESLLGGMLHAADSATEEPHAAAVQEMTPAYRAGLHAMLDYVIDNGRAASISALCDNIRVYFQELRNTAHVEGPVSESIAVAGADDPASAKKLE